MPIIFHPELQIKNFQLPPLYRSSSSNDVNENAFWWNRFEIKRLQNVKRSPHMTSRDRTRSNLSYSENAPNSHNYSKHKYHENELHALLPPLNPSGHHLLLRTLLNRHSFIQFRPEIEVGTRIKIEIGIGAEIERVLSLVCCAAILWVCSFPKTDFFIK